MSLYTLSHVTKHFGAEFILDDVSFRVEPGDHIALVGSNGAGKSTLLRIIAGHEEPDAGVVGGGRGTLVVYLPQVPEFDPTFTLYEVMLDVFSDVIAAQERLRSLEIDMAGEHSSERVEEYGRLQSLIEHRGYDYRERIERVLVGLELEQNLWYQPVAQLSGGQRTRANLGRTLLHDADLLLLDEPTNHLDIGAVEWLESYLRDLKQAFILVAHDRYLLDRVTRRTFELSFCRLTAFDAPYSRYRILKAEQMERQRTEFEAQQRHIEKTEDFIRRYGAGQRSREARGRQKRLDRLERIERPQDEPTVNLQLQRVARSGDIVLEEHGLVAGYPDAPLVRMPAQVTVRRGAKIAVIGPNGSGKTTLLLTLIGSLPPLAGEARWGAGTSIAYYSQTLAHLDGEKTVLEEIQSVRPMAEDEARGYLGRFLFTEDDAFKRIAVLSGGERSRVALAKLILEEPNVLALDEPTNHLDIASREALQSVLADFHGTLLLVSHDRYLIDSLVDELWVIRDGDLARYAGNYSALASGDAKPLDHGADTPPSRAGVPDSPAARVRRLDDEAEALAGRLAQSGASAQLGQLAELTDRYAELLSALQEAQSEWLDELRKEFPGYLGSRARSGAGRRR